MLVLPLGLGTKLRRLPIVTIAIGVLWVAVFVLDRAGQRVPERVFDAVARSGMRDTSRALFVQYCKSRKGTSAACRKYSVLIWTGAPAKGQPPEAQLDRLPAEMKAAEKLKEELSDCSHSRRCFAYRQILGSFLDAQEHRPGLLTRFKAYTPYKRSLRKYRRDLRRLCAQDLCLVRGNINLASLFAAQVRHGGFGHLFGNLIAFLLFGVYVEQRTSRWLYAAGVVVGGTVGMAVHTAFFGSGDFIALGGSANVSAVMGMFYVFFFHARMRFLVWLPRTVYLGSSFFADVKYCFPLMFVLSDVAGGIGHGVSDLLSTKVAHFAHLTGLAVGMLFALGIAAWRRLPRPYLYEGEADDMRQLQHTREPAKMLDLASRMIEVNPENVHALEVACGSFLRWASAVQPNEQAAVQDRGRAFLAEHLQTVCAVNARRGEVRYACKILSQVPLFLPYRVYLGRLGQVSTLKLGDFALSEGHPILALRLYDYFLTRFPLSVKCKAIDDTAAGLIAALTPGRETVAAVTTYLQYHPDSQLSARLGAWLTNVHLRRA